jgi:hypothetical protein
VSSSKIQVPVNVTDPLVLRRFLSTLVEQLDIAFGYRGNTPFVATQSLEATQGNVTVINANLVKLNQDLLAALTAANAYTDNNTTENPEQAAIVNLDYGVGTVATFGLPEVKPLVTDIDAVSDKLDIILAALRSAGIVAAE